MSRRRLFRGKMQRAALLRRIADYVTFAIILRAARAAAAADDCKAITPPPRYIMPPLFSLRQPMRYASAMLPYADDGGASPPLIRRALLSRAIFSLDIPCWRQRLPVYGAAVMPRRADDIFIR